MSMRIVIKGDQKLKLLIRNLVKQGVGKNIHREMALSGEKWTRSNFQKQGGLLKGGAWKPVTAATQKRKTEAGWGSKTLVASGRQLRPTLNSRFDFSGAYVGWGSKLAAFHGSDRPRRKMPLRRLLPKTEEIMPRLIQDLQAWYKKIITRSGWKVRQSK